MKHFVWFFRFVCIMLIGVLIYGFKYYYPGNDFVCWVLAGISTGMVGLYTVVVWIDPPKEY
jgi:hypothetical protein